MSEARILVVEDDPQMQRLMKTQLTAHGFEVHVVDNGPDAMEYLADESPGLILLDITLPGPDGLEICRELREWSTVPVILVTAADRPQTKITALGLGADDYLTKPFHPGELIARIRAVLRRSKADAAPHPNMIHVGDLHIDLKQRNVHQGKQPVHLTKTEFDLLKELVTNGDRVLTYKHLMEEVWGTGQEDLRTVHVHICNLRRKLERGPTAPRHILAVPGVGYRFRLGD